MSDDENLMSIISNVLNVDVSRLTNKTQAEDIESWDSFNSMLLISEIESEFDVEFTMKEMSHVRSIQDIKNILFNKGISNS